MKAALGSVPQLDDRVRRLRRMGLPLRLELHTFSDNLPSPGNTLGDGVSYLSAIRESEPLQLFVHVPPQHPAVVTSRPFDRDQVFKAVDLAESVDADGIVLHRYYGLAAAGQSMAISKRDAEAGFNAEVRAIARRLGSRRALVENLGFFWLQPRAGRRYLAGPLEHFFPWEIGRFVKWLENANICNVEPMLDVAHATLSANMYSLLKRDYWTYREDPRFQGITDADLDQCASLTAYDFLSAQPNYLHVSDAIPLAPDARHPLDHETIHTALTSESLPLGAGGLDFALIVRILSRAPHRPRTLVLEVNPVANSDHVLNPQQEEGIRVLQELEKRARHGDSPKGTG